MAENLGTCDSADDLSNDEAIALFMDEAFATNESAYVAHAQGVVARAKGMTQVPKHTGLSREQLYRSLGENGNPTLSTTLAVLDALGIGLTTRSRNTA